MAHNALRLFFILTLVITLSACGGGGGGSSSDDSSTDSSSPNNITTTNTPTDTNPPTDTGPLPSVNINTTDALSTHENNGVAAFTVSLGTQPTAAVEISLSTSDTTEGTISPETLTFTPENWNESQTVFVTGVDDNEADGNVTFDIISAAAVSDDENYDGLNPIDISVVSVDDETAGEARILISDITGLQTVEGADSASFSIMLATPPTASTTIGLITTDAAEGFVNPSTLTFTPENWNIPQLVNVIGQDDSVADGSTSYAIVTTPALSTDPNYNNLNASDIIITNIDNDTRPVINTFELDTNSIPYAGSATLTWDSNAQTCSASGATAAGQWQDENLPGSGSTLISNIVNAGTYDFALTCTTDNIDSLTRIASLQVAPQLNEPSITFNASRVANIAYNGATTLTWSAETASSCTAEGGWSGSRATTNIAGELITGLTQDTTFTLQCSSPEGTSTRSIDVQVNAATPAIDFLRASENQIDQGRSITLAWQSSDTRECTAVSTPLNNDWVDEQDVTNGLGVAINNLQESTTFTLNCIGVDDSEVTRTTLVAVNAAGIEVSPSDGLSTTELGGTASFDIVLTTKPIAATSIGLQSSDPSEGTVTPTSISFDTENWNIPQSILVTGQDDLIVDGPVNYSIVTNPAVSTDPVYSGANAIDVNVVNTDNDVQAVISTFSASATSVLFGAPVTLTWESDGESCAASGSTAGGQWQGDDLPASGSQVLTNLSEAGVNTFMLTCQLGGINSEVAAVQVSVAPQIDAPTVTLTANPVANIPFASATTLTWSTTDTQSCVASGGWTGDRAISNSQGEVIQNLTTDTTFTLTCTGPGGTGASTVAVTVTPANPAIAFFTATPETVIEGDATTLTWQTNDVSECTANANPAIAGWAGTVAPNNVNGQAVNNIQENIAFTLSCVGIDGTNLSETINVTTQPRPPTVTLSASPDEVEFNGATNLTWSSTDATACTTSGGWTGARDVENNQGESIDNLTANTSFTLTCTGPGGSASATESVNVIPVNANVTLSASPANIEVSGSTTLTWSSNDLTSCTASATPANAAWTGTVEVSNATGITINDLQESTTFNLNCVAIDNSAVSDSINVSTQFPEPTVSLVATPNEVNFGGATTLTWSSTEASTCTASGGWSGTRDTENSQGEIIENLTTNTTFTLTCTGLGGNAAASQTVSVTPASVAINSFSATPSTIDQGGSTILAWSTNDVTSCEASADPSNASWSGAVAVDNISGVTISGLQETTSFTLGCTGIDNSNVERSVQVNVNAVNLAGDIERGRQLYLNPIEGSAFSCADCHGTDGVPIFVAPRDINTTPCFEGRCENEEILAAYTTEAMPIGTSPSNPLCDAQCGRDIAAYMFSEIINQGNNEGDSLPIANSAFFEGVSPLPDETVMRKAAIMVAGRLPTDAELATAGNRDAMQQALINMMQGPGFDNFIEESVNDRLLTNALTITNVVYSGDYPRISNIGGNTQRRNDFIYGVQRESQELFKYVINNNRPYSEVLVADYIMVNPETAFLYEANLIDQFPNNANRETFVRGRIGSNMGGRLFGPYPHAGVLNQPGYLSRWNTTDTNRNRERARVTADFFLGLDLEALAVRVIDTNAANNEPNPTLTNANCTVCHNTVDPIAGAFQNFGVFRHRYRNRAIGGSFNTLSGDYVFNERDANGNRIFQNGDFWYRTMLQPGYPFTGATMPANRNDTALRWLGEQMTADPRFDVGTVRFWYQSLFGRPAVVPPVEENRTQQLVFDAQNALFEEIGRTFRESGHDFKVMLSELILSPWFRAGTVDNANANRPELEELGMGRILTPEQLDRKLLAVFGRTWNNLLGNNDFYLTYGSFDSDGLSTRNDQLSSIMSSMIDLLSNRISCEMVRDDFNTNINNRNLFPHVNPNDTPSSNEQAIRENLVHLHQLILGQTLNVNDAEITRSFNLLSDILEVTRADNTNPPCGGVNDSNFTQRSWMAMMSYFIGSYEFLYE